MPVILRGNSADRTVIVDVAVAGDLPDSEAVPQQNRQSTSSSTTSLPFRSLDVRPTDALDDLIAAEIAVEVSRENEIPPLFESPFEHSLEYLRFGKAASLGDSSNPVGDFDGHDV